MKKLTSLAAGLAAFSMLTMTARGSRNASAALTPISTSAAAKATTAMAQHAAISAYIVEHQLKTKHVDVSYPQLTGLTDAVAQKKLNALLKQSCLPSPENSPSPAGSPPTDYSASYNLLLVRGNIMEIMIDSYSFLQGAAHGMPGQTVFIIDLGTGKVYQLRDLFRVGSPYLPVISNLIRKQDTQHVLDSFGTFTGVTAKDNFYLTDDGLIIYFLPYQWTAFALGFPEYHIPYTQLSSIIRTDGPLWKAFHTEQAATELKMGQAHRAHITSLGYVPVAKQAAQTPDDSVQALYAYDAKPKGSADGTVEKVFFFVGNRYLGTDTLHNHDAIINLYPVNRSTIAVDYMGNGAPFTIRYRWDGKKLIPDRAFPLK